jgi:hypothetical protein
VILEAAANILDEAASPSVHDRLTKNDSEMARAILKRLRKEAGRIPSRASLSLGQETMIGAAKLSEGQVRKILGAARRQFRRPRK